MLFLTAPQTQPDLKSGDKIISINGKKVENWEDVRTDIFINTLGQNLSVKLLRDGQPETLDIQRKLIPSAETNSLFLIPSGVRPLIASVMPKSPALKAGIKSGDILLSLNNTPLYSSSQVTEIVKSHKGVAMPLEVQRDKENVNLSVTPGNDGLIGVELRDTFTGPVIFEKFGIFESFYYGWQYSVKMTELTFSMAGKVIHGKIAFGKAFGGPIKIAQYAVQSADNGILSFMLFLAMLSLSLAIINILPFPVLDGGHLVMIIIEGITKREIPIKVKIAIQNVGFVLLILLMAFIIYNDLISL